jgi:phage virion morphogenesis protein
MSVKLTGDWRRLDRALGGLAESGLFLRIHKLIGEAMVTATKERFMSETDVSGRPFIPSRRALEEGGQTLTDTARLKRSIGYKAGASQVEWGTNVVYAARHNFGDAIVRGRRGGGMPRRQFLGLSRTDQETIQEIITETLGGAVK